MARYEATFEIDAKSDVHAVRRLTERVYDTLREELRHTGRGDATPNETLEQFEAIREAARRSSPGTLTVVYEQRDEPFDE